MRKKLLVFILFAISVLFVACDKKQDEVANSTTVIVENKVNTISNEEDNDLEEEIETEMEDDSIIETEMGDETEAYSNETISVNTPKVSVTQIYHAFTTDFGDNYYQIRYSTENEDEKTGYMNSEGKIFSNYPKSYDNEDNGFILYNEDGTVACTKESSNNLGDFEVLCSGEEKYLVLNYRSGLDEAVLYVGIMDKSGNWLSNYPIDLQELTGVDLIGKSCEAHYLEEGMFGINFIEDNCFLLFNVENGNCIYMNTSIWNVTRNATRFYNGTMIYQEYYGNHLGNICAVSKDGTVTALVEDEELLYVNENGFITDANSYYDVYELLSYDNKGNKLWTFDKYKIENVRNPVMYENNVFAFIEGADGLSYLACINQQTGELVCQPFRHGMGSICEHYVIAGKKGELEIIDILTGETVAVLDSELEFEESDVENRSLELERQINDYRLFPNFCLYYEWEYYFFDVNGQEIIPALAE